VDKAEDLESSLRAGLKRLFESTTVSAVSERYAVSLVNHQATGRTVHRYRGEMLPKPASLAVARIGDDPGFYLLYFDESRKRMTDTYHETLDGAFAQATFEFDVEPNEWQKAGENAI
jgi:hypothetical protein